MPFVEIPRDRMEHLPLFGYDHLGDDDGGAWYSGPRGRTYVEYHRPTVWVDDIADAIQLGAIGVLAGPDD